uniref:Uncharacterized protein n=1 Tax=Pristionchus pacificus TaxID=54126 RepID=A0A2A6CGD6_PRIPA|eukprot:PDM77123.1 hypothetical protein PRIPAC_43035 [Pristionchus pacificus]
MDDGDDASEGMEKKREEEDMNWVGLRIGGGRVATRGEERALFLSKRRREKGKDLHTLCYEWREERHGDPRRIRKNLEGEGISAGKDSRQLEGITSYE